MVNSNGFVYEQLEDPTPPENGFDLRLTLDIDGQLAAERALKGYIGAFVVMDANSGASDKRRFPEKLRSAGDETIRSRRPSL